MNYWITFLLVLIASKDCILRADFVPLTDPPAFANLKASETYKFQVCDQTDVFEVKAPAFYKVYVEKLVYGISQNATCHAYSEDDCTSNAVITCTLRGKLWFSSNSKAFDKFDKFKKDSCQYRLTRYTVKECNNVQAQYLYGEYRFIPYKSTTLFSMGDNQNEINLDSSPYGIIISHNYPSWEELVNRTRTLATRDPKSAISLYIVDMFIQEYSPECDGSYLEMNDDVS